LWTNVRYLVANHHQAATANPSYETTHFTMGGDTDSSAKNLNEGPPGEAVGYGTVRAVDESWKHIRTIPNYEVVAGEILFRKIFELAPGALGMFSFGAHFEVEDDGLYSSPLFKRHARGLFQMLDAAIQMLGPDMEPLSVELKELGARHTGYGVLPPHYAVVGQALLFTLEAALGDKWTPTVQKGWEGVYHFVSSAMMEGAEELLAKQAANEKEDKEKSRFSEPVLS
jgi:Globin